MDIRELINKLREARQERAGLVSDMRATVELALAEKRAQTPAEDKQYADLKAKVDALTKQIDTDAAEVEAYRAEALANPSGEWASGDGQHRGSYGPGNRNGQSPLIFRTKDGREVRAVRSNESFAAAVRSGTPGGPGSDISVGQFIRSMITGARSPAEQRALAETTQSGGAYLIPTPLATELIDVLRNATQVVRAGAVTIPMDSATLSFARAKADPAVAWKVELNPIVPADPGLEGVILTAHTLVGMTIISVEVAEDAIGGEQVIADMLGKALALELDRVALVGSGTPPEPKGVLGAQDVQTTAHDKPFADYGVLSDAIAKLWTANSEPNGIIWHPNVQAAA